jgi:hypothetical protein
MRPNPRRGALQPALPRGLWPRWLASQPAGAAGAARPHAHNKLVDNQRLVIILASRAELIRLVCARNN